MKERLPNYVIEFFRSERGDSIDSFIQEVLKDFEAGNKYTVFYNVSVIDFPKYFEAMILIKSIIHECNKLDEIIDLKNDSGIYFHMQRVFFPTSLFLNHINLLEECGFYCETIEEYGEEATCSLTFELNLDKTRLI